MSTNSPQEVPAQEETSTQKSPKTPTKRAPRRKKDESPEPIPAETSAPKIVKRRAPKSTNTPEQTITTPPSPLPEPPSHTEIPSDSPRFGRIPGGGPISRANQETPPTIFIPSSSNQPKNSREPHAKQPRHREQPPQRTHQQQDGRQRNSKQKHNTRRPLRQDHPKSRESAPQTPPLVLTGEKTECNGLLEFQTKGAFLRTRENRFIPQPDDIFLTPEIIRQYHLRPAQWIQGLFQQSSRGPHLIEVTAVNDLIPNDAKKLPYFEELKAINPEKRISFETEATRFTTRVLDLVAPVGRGQRGLIVSPPRSGKTTLLLDIAKSIEQNYTSTIHLIIVLIDERPEEVTEFRRTLPNAEIYASSNDEQTRSHTRIAELAIERAKRLVEAGRDVLILMDSITRLARAYNQAPQPRGRGIGSGGLTIGSLEIPRRLFAAARNTREAGSLTILATALIQTNSKADEAIFQEFKGTGNMELVLDRRMAELYLYPAVDIFKSGTRREELLLPEHTLQKMFRIRRGLSGHRPPEALERLLSVMKKFPSNPQMLMEIK